MFVKNIRIFLKKKSTGWISVVKKIVKYGNIKTLYKIKTG